MRFFKLIIMIGVLTLSFFSFVLAKKDDFSKWQGSRELVLNTTTSEATIANNVKELLVVVLLNASNFDFNQAKNNGKDVVFTLSDNSTVLPCLIEEWNKSSKTARLLIKVPNVQSNNSTQSIKMFWGKSDFNAADGKVKEISSNNDYMGIFDTNNAFKIKSKIDKNSGVNLNDRWKK